MRYLLSQGRIKDADAILGHAHAVEGTVVHGEERGRTIGFPTANLSENVAGYLPVDGVYARLAGRFGGEVRRRWRRSRGEAGRRRIAAV